MKNISRSTIRKVSALVIAVFAVTFVFNVYLIPDVFAADLTEASVRLDRTDVSHLATTSDPILVVLKTATVGTEENIYITFESGFTVDGTNTNVTSTVTGIPSTYQGESLTALPGLGANANATSGQNAEFDATDLTVGTLYGFFITGGITNPGSAAEYEITIAARTSGDATIDSKTVAVDIVSDGSDLVTVTANVVPTFSFALSGNSIALGDLTTSSVTTGNITVTVDTNAGSGWIAFTKSANTSLDSASTSDTIETQGTVDNAVTAYSSGVDFYQLDIQVSDGTGSGTPSVDAEYDGNSTTSGGTFSTTHEEIAISDGPGTGDGITFTVMAAASSTTESADDYTDTLTVVGAGNF